MRGTLHIVSAPSGAGKTTLVRLLLEEDTDGEVNLSISYTTRQPRPGEVNGREYHFVDMTTFRRMAEAGDFLEWAEVHGNCYGTSKKWISDQLLAGNDVVLEIDWQGAQQVRKIYPNSVGIFILPPSPEELERRLTDRATESPEVIARRLAVARAEMGHMDEFDYVIINNQLQEAVEDLRSIVHSSHLRLAPQKVHYAELFARMI